MYFCLPNLTNPMYIQYLGETVLPSHHNAVGVHNQVTFLILFYRSSRLIPLLDVINTPIQVPDIVDLTVNFQFLNFRFKYAFFLFLKYLLASHLTLFRLSTLLWLGSCI